MKKTSCDREKSYWRRVGVICFSLILVLTSWVNVQAGLSTELTGVRGKAGYSETEAMDVFGKLVGIVLGFMGVVVLVIILLGGFKWITSGGAEDKIKSAQKLIAAGAVGLLIVASAYAISSFVTKKVVKTGGVAYYSNTECAAEATRVGQACYYEDAANKVKIDGTCGQTNAAPGSEAYGCVIPKTSCPATVTNQPYCHPETGLDKGKVYVNQCPGAGGCAGVVPLTTEEVSAAKRVKDVAKTVKDAAATAKDAAATAKDAAATAKNAAVTATGELDEDVTEETAAATKAVTATATAMTTAIATAVENAAAAATEVENAAKTATEVENAAKTAAAKATTAIATAVENAAKTAETAAAAAETAATAVETVKDVAETIAAAVKIANAAETAATVAEDVAIAAKIIAVKIKAAKEVKVLTAEDANAAIDSANAAIGFADEARGFADEARGFAGEARDSANAAVN